MIFNIECKQSNFGKKKQNYMYSKFYALYVLFQIGNNFTIYAHKYSIFYTDIAIYNSQNIIYQ